MNLDKMPYSETCLSNTSFEPAYMCVIDRCAVYTGYAS